MQIIQLAHSHKGEHYQSLIREANGLQHAYLCWPNFNVEVTALIGNFQDFWPSETIDSQSVFVNEEPIRTHAQLDVHAF